jgi:hypothetical protein
VDELPNLANQTITGEDRAGGNNAIEDEDDDEYEDDCEKPSRPSWLLLLTARGRTWSRNRHRNHFLQLGPMKGVADDYTDYENEADQENGADTIRKPVAVLRAVFF